MTTDELETELQTLKAANASLSEHLLKLSEELGQAKADNAALAHARDTFKTGFETQSKLNEELIAANAKLREEIAGLKPKL